MKMQTTGSLTKSICNNLGFDYDSGFIEAAEKEGKIFISAGLGRKEEFFLLARKIEEANPSLNYHIAPALQRLLEREGYNNIGQYRES